MFAIREGVINLIGMSVPTFSRNVDLGDETFIVEAGSGVCNDEKCREKRWISFLSLFCPTHGVFASSIRDKDGWNGGVELTAYGKDALDGLITSLEFALTALRDARAGVRD